MEEVLAEIDDDTDQPYSMESDDDFEDIHCEDGELTFQEGESELTCTNPPPPAPTVLSVTPSTTLLGPSVGSLSPVTGPAEPHPTTTAPSPRSSCPVSSSLNRTCS